MATTLGSSGMSSGLGDAASGIFSSFFGKKDHHHHHQASHQSSYPSEDDDSGNLLVIVVLLLFAFGIYKLFLSGNASHGRSDHNSYTGYHRDNRYDSTTGPPPPGFKPDYTGKTGQRLDNPVWIRCRNSIRSFWLFRLFAFRVYGFQPRLRIPKRLHSVSAVPRRPRC